MTRAESQAAPYQLIMMVVILSGAVIGLNRVSPLIASGILAASLAGIAVLLLWGRAEARREAGKLFLSHVEVPGPPDRIH